MSASPPREDPKTEEVTKRERTTSEGSAGDGSGSGSGDVKVLSAVEARRLQWTRVRTMSTCADGRRIVLLAVDPSENSQIAFDWYLDNVFKPEDNLLIVHCPEAPRLPTFSFKSGIAPPLHEWKEILDEMNQKTRKLEEDYEAACIQKKLRYKVRGEAMKHPGEGIIRIADEEKVDLICLGTRGQSGMKRMLLGSVSDYVIRNSQVPVIVVPGKKLMKRRLTLAALEADGQ